MARPRFDDESDNDFLADLDRSRKKHKPQRGDKQSRKPAYASSESASDDEEVYDEDDHDS